MRFGAGLWEEGPCGCTFFVVVFVPRSVAFYFLFFFIFFALNKRANRSRRFYPFETLSASVVIPKC